MTSTITADLEEKEKRVEEFEMGKEEKGKIIQFSLKDLFYLSFSNT